MKFSVHPKQRIVLLVAAAVIAGSEVYQLILHGEAGLRGLLAYALATVCAFVALRAPKSPEISQPGTLDAHLADGYAPAKRKQRKARKHADAPAAQFDQAAPASGMSEEDVLSQVDKYHALIVLAGQRLYETLLDRFVWEDVNEERSLTARQIFSESCIILGYYLVSLSLSGPTTKSLLRSIDGDLKLRTTATIIGLEGKCAPIPGEELSPTCKALTAHNLSLLDSFRHLFARTVENFHRGHPYPLNDLLGGIFMLFEGHVSPEPDYWEHKYGDAVYTVIDEIAAERRGRGAEQLSTDVLTEARQ